MTYVIFSVATERKDGPIFGASLHNFHVFVEINLRNHRERRYRTLVSTS